MQTLTVDEVAARLKRRPEWVRRLIRRKELRGYNMGTQMRPCYRVKEQDLTAFMDERTVNDIERD